MTGGGGLVAMAVVATSFHHAACCLLLSCNAVLLFHAMHVPHMMVLLHTHSGRDQNMTVLSRGWATSTNTKKKKRTAGVVAISSVDANTERNGGSARGSSARSSSYSTTKHGDAAAGSLQRSTEGGS